MYYFKIIRGFYEDYILLNPKAGKGRGLDKIKEAVARASQELDTEAGAYLQSQ